MTIVGSFQEKRRLKTQKYIIRHQKRCIKKKNLKLEVPLFPAFQTQTVT